MNKYLEVAGELTEIRDYILDYNHSHHFHSCRADLFVELFNTLDDILAEKIEFESRKDKLIVGSEWECVVECYGAFNFIGVGERVRIIDVFGGEGVLAIQYLDSELFDQLPTSQFLYCFKPVMKGE